VSESAGMGKAVLITSTGLGVGKSFITTGLAVLLRERGLDVGVMKPIEIGWPAEAGEWPADAEQLRDAAGSDDPLEDICPYIYEEFIAPQLAADHARRPIELDVIKASLKRLRKRHDIVLIEGVGGLAVPIDDGIDLATMAAECGASVLIVTCAHVGTLNTTFLTVHYARSRKLEVLGAIANRLDMTLEDPTVPTNAKMIQRMCDIPVFGVVPFSPEADGIEGVAEVCRSNIDIDQFMKAAGLG